MVEMENTGDPRVRSEIVAMIEHLFSDRDGEWRVAILGSRASDNWEMKVEGTKGFERSYSLTGPNEHKPEVIRGVLLKLLR
jgi:hypothetical protein